jgi:uncharacterized LabA/DUF88 family protein
MSAFLYCDNDNIQYKNSCGFIEKLLPDTSILCYKIFGSVTELAKLDEECRAKHEYIICPKPVAKGGETNKKNGSDIRLCIEIMDDLIIHPNIHTIIICSNDTDFIPLCQRIKKTGRNCWLINDTKNTQNKQNEYLEKFYNKVLDINAERKKEEALRRLQEKKEEELQYISEEKAFKKSVIRIINNLFSKLDTSQISFPTIIEEFTKNDLDWRSKNSRFKAFLQKYLLDTKYKILLEQISQK